MSCVFSDVMPIPLPHPPLDLSTLENLVCFCLFCIDKEIHFLVRNLPHKTGVLKPGKVVPSCLDVDQSSTCGRDQSSAFGRKTAYHFECLANLFRHWTVDESD